MKESHSNTVVYLVALLLAALVIEIPILWICFPHKQTADSVTLADEATGLQEQEQTQNTQQSFVTYFDQLYYAYTHPDEYLNKEMTVVGYYSNTLADAETGAEETSVYHFVTTYGQIDECRLTVEFTAADGVYPDVGKIVSVTGVLNSYEEDNNTYYTLTADTVTVLDTDTSSSSDSAEDTQE